MNTKKSNLLFSKSEFFGTISKHNYLLINQNNLSKKYYQNILAYDLILKQNYKNIMQLTRLEKILLNTTSKNYVHDKKFILFTLVALELLSGQKPKLTYARKSIANFKIRQHQILGCKVVLGKNLMYPFLDKLSRIIFPRIRDGSNFFKKIGKTKKKMTLESKQTFLSIKKKTPTKSYKLKAYTYGLKNLMLFPELENHYQLVEIFRGMNLTFVLSGSTNKLNSNLTEKSKELILSGFQLPFK